jgi:hypothetical protein
MWLSAINMLIVCVLFGMQIALCAPPVSPCYRFLQKLAKIRMDINELEQEVRATQGNKEVDGKASKFPFLVVDFLISIV